MGRYLIAYDLSKDVREYEALDAQLRALEKDSVPCRVLESTWLVETDLSPQQILRALGKTDTEGNNHFLIVGIDGPWAGIRLRTDSTLKSWFGPPDAQ